MDLEAWLQTHVMAYEDFYGKSKNNPSSINRGEDKDSMVGGNFTKDIKEEQLKEKRITFFGVRRGMESYFNKHDASGCGPPL